MAPVPVFVLPLVALFVVRAIALMSFGQVAAVGVVFAIISVVVVMVARVINSNLNAGFLRRCSQNGSADQKGSCKN